MAATAASELCDGPVLNLINKRLRALRKKHNRILQMEESLAQGKPLNKEQEEVLRSKPGVVALIEELDKLRQPLSAALQEELDLALRASLPPPSAPPAPPASTVRVSDDDDRAALEKKAGGEAENGKSDEVAVEDLLQLLYFGSLFDVRPQSEYNSTMLTRTHERGCCLAYDYVTDEATDMLKERDLDLISKLGGLLISRPLNAALSHESALQRCINHARLWLSKSDSPIEPDSPITYVALRERLNKIMVSDYFTTTPEIKAPVELAAAGAVGSYASFQVPVHGSAESVAVLAHVEGSVAQHRQTDEGTGNLVKQESGDNVSGSVEEDEMENHGEISQEQVKPQVEEQNERDAESKGQQFVQRRTYPNQRGGRNGGYGGGGGGRKGYPNGRSGRSGGRSSGAYQNGRNHYYDQPGNYYSKNYYNNRGRGGDRGSSGGQSYYSNGSAGQGHSGGDVNLAS